MTYGLGAGGALGVALETSAAPGTWVTPAVSVPITNETLTYTEERYYSTAIRQQTVANDVRQGYYHIAGDISFEVDTRYMPYFLYGSRWGVSKTVGPPAVYTFSPSSTATVPSTNRTLSITVLKNGAVFAYSGCQVTQMVFTITNGILMCTVSIIGTTDNSGQSYTPSFSSPPRILSAPCHNIYLVDGATATGTITVGSPVLNFDGFTATINDNGAVQNRINASRAAAFVSYGITDLQVTSSLDFLDKTEYTKFLSTSRKSMQLLSTGNTTGVTAGHDIFQMDFYDMVYDVYNVELGSWESLIMAQATLRGVASGGTNPPADIIITSDSAIVPA